MVLAMVIAHALYVFNRFGVRRNERCSAFVSNMFCRRALGGVSPGPVLRGVVAWALYFLHQRSLLYVLHSVCNAGLGLHGPCKVLLALVLQD